MFLALPPRPPNISMVSLYPSPDANCGVVMILSCTSNPVDNLFTPPIIIWSDINGDEVPTGRSSNPSVDPQTRQLIINGPSAGTYVCCAVIDILEAKVVNFFDKTAISLTNSGE